MVKKRWILLLQLFFITNTLLCQKRSLEQGIASIIDNYGAIGVTVAVVKSGEIVYTNAFGIISREDSALLRSDNLFRIASISKTFVSTAIMQLVENGKLSLDDDVNQYLDFLIQNPRYPNSSITIKMLLCHRSSINDSQGWNTFDKINPVLNPDYIKCYSDYKPGTKFEYCNMNYNLLGAVIEKVTHERFDKYIYKHITKPMRLHGSFNKFDMDSSMFVKSYWYDKNKDNYILASNVYQPFQRVMQDYVLGYSTTSLSPPAGMIISAHELAKYMLMHINMGYYNKKRIIDERSESIMREVPASEKPYALSISHYTNIILREKLLGQTGGQYGFHTAMIFHPEKKYGFVVLCNGCKSKSKDGHEMNFEIIQELYKGLIENSK